MNPNRTFCQFCRHPSDIAPGHDADCPVYTGEPVAGTYVGPMQQNAQVQSQMAGTMGSVPEQPCPYCGAYNGHYWFQNIPCPGSRQGPVQDGWEVARIYRDAREKLLEELKAMAERNRQLFIENVNLKAELASLKLKP